MTIPHIKLTKTMLNKYIIDAKKDILEQFGIEPDQSDGVETWEEPILRKAQYCASCIHKSSEDDVYLSDGLSVSSETYDILNGDYDPYINIKFYMTARGDKRLSIPKLNQYGQVGDYVHFHKDNGFYHIYISKELPLDKKEYEQLQLRFG